MEAHKPDGRMKLSAASRKAQEVAKGGWESKPVKMESKNDLLPYLMEKAKSGEPGLFVATLLTFTGAEQHCVGIDTKGNLIYDCAEDFTLPLTQSNLDRADDATRRVRCWPSALSSGARRWPWSLVTVQALG